MTKSTRGLLYLLAAAMTYSFLPVFIRFLNAEKVAPQEQMLLRYCFAFLAAGVYFLVSRSKFSFERKSLVLLLLAAFFGSPTCFIPTALSTPKFPPAYSSFTLLPS